MQVTPHAYVAISIHYALFRSRKMHVYRDLLVQKNI